MKYFTLVLIMIIQPSLSWSRPYCNARDMIVTQLQDKYSESQSAIGLTRGATHVLELFTSPEGSWTILLTTPDGKTCAMAAGGSWTEIENPKHGEQG